MRPTDHEPARREGATRATDARVLREMDLDRHLADPAIKQRLVTPLFDVVAPRYDRFTRIFSFGMDASWKRELLAGVERLTPAGATVFDLASGTGDLALAVARRVPGAKVTGIDASRAMVEAAERRRPAEIGDRVRFTVGDMTSIPAADATVDLVTAGYALRNAPDFREVVREVRRVLKPGGLFLTLDFYRPESPFWRRLFVGYLRAAGAVVGWLWHREPVVYAYLGPSVDHYVSCRALGRELESAGFEVTGITPKLLGGIAIHRARVPALREKHRAGG